MWMINEVGKGVVVIICDFNLIVVSVWFVVEDGEGVFDMEFCEYGVGV